MCSYCAWCPAPVNRSHPCLYTPNHQVSRAAVQPHLEYSSAVPSLPSLPPPWSCPWRRLPGCCHAGPAGSSGAAHHHPLLHPPGVCEYHIVRTTDLLPLPLLANVQGVEPIQGGQAVDSHRTSLPSQVDLIPECCGQVLFTDQCLSLNHL